MSIAALTFTGHVATRCAASSRAKAAGAACSSCSVAKHAYKVTDEDIAAARASRLSEDQIFEIVVCAAIGQATRQYDTALAALEDATEKD